MEELNTRLLAILIPYDKEQTAGCIPSGLAELVHIIIFSHNYMIHVWLSVNLHYQSVDVLLLAVASAFIILYSVPIFHYYYHQLWVQLSPMGNTRFLWPGKLSYIITY